MEDILFNLNNNLLGVNNLITKMNYSLEITNTKTNNVNDILTDKINTVESTLTDNINKLIKAAYQIKLVIDYDYDNLYDTGLTAILYNFNIFESSNGSFLDQYGYYKLSSDEIEKIKELKITITITDDEGNETATTFSPVYFDPYSVNKPENDEYIIIKTLSIQSYTVDNLNTITRLTNKYTILSNNPGSTLINNSPTFAGYSGYNYVRYVPTYTEDDDTTEMEQKITVDSDGTETTYYIWKPSRKYWPIMYEHEYVRYVYAGYISYVYTSGTNIISVDPQDDYVQTNHLTNDISSKPFFQNTTLTTLKNIEKIINDDDFNESLRHMFNGCSSLTNISALQHYNMSKKLAIDSMFRGCTALASIDLPNFNTSNVTDISTLFYGCSNIKL